MKCNIISDVRNGDKGDVAKDLWQVFRTRKQGLYRRAGLRRVAAVLREVGANTRSIRKRGEDVSYKSYFTYLNYDYHIQSMLYTTNWIERLQKDFRRVTRMRGAMPNGESVILLMSKTTMDKTSYRMQIPKIDLDKELFPDE